MFDIGGFEILILIIVALVVLKPEDLPKAMRGFGRVVRKINHLGREFYTFFDDIAYEIETKENDEEEKIKEDNDIKE